MASPESPTSEQTLEGGSYEVIRRRLLEQAADLSRRTQTLNRRRQQLFGGGELSLVATERVRTPNNCVPRDVVTVDGHLLFGFQVFLGLKSETTVADILTLYRFAEAESGIELSAADAQEPLGAFLRNEEFDKQFRDAFRYSKEARLLQLRRTDTRLLIVLQVGSTHRDIKVLRFAIDAQKRVTFMDARGEEDCVPPRAHPFEWTITTRENHVAGPHPHVNILDQVFVETVGGDLTVKIENNTQTGQGIYAEPVEDKNQSLDDAEFAYAKVGGLTLLRIKPFREEKPRYLVYNPRTEQALRIDALEQACVELPENHGIVFPGGYYLHTGEYRLFDGDTSDLIYERMIPSPNGEDVLYVFYRQQEGAHELLPYNLVKKEVTNPIRCHGYTLLPDGKMVVFRASPSEEPTRVHPIQIWKTPFVTAEFAASSPTDGSYLAKVGNADLVAAISEVLSICRLATQERPNRRTFEDIVGSVGRLLGAHYWLGHAEAEGLADGLKTIRGTTELLVSEFEKALLIEKRAREALAETETVQRDLLNRIRASELHQADAFLAGLTELRRHRGKLASLKELRGMEVARVVEFESELAARFDEISRACVDSFLQENAFSPLLIRIDALVAGVEKVEKSVELTPLSEELGAIQEGLSLLTETVGGLKIDDPTNRTRILDGASSAFAQQNRARAIFDGKQRSLAAAEGRAEFAVQFKLLGQSVTAALSLATTPDACDKQLAQLMLQFEELDGRFGMLEEFSAELATKREEVVDSVAARRQVLVEERQRRARHLVSTADRIMTGVLRRAKALQTIEELNAYFVSDPMVQKLGELRDKLRELDESVQADELEAKLVAAKQTALRMLRDKTDLFEGEGNLIRFGTHRFTVSELALDLTVVPKDGALWYHLTGTDFYESIDDPRLNDAREFWEQDLVSETPEIYRGEFLAASLVLAAEAGQSESTSAGLDASLRDGKVGEFVRAAALERLDEGYEPGVHDHDAQLLLERIWSVTKTAGALRFTPTARALAWLCWLSLPTEQRALVERRARSAGRLATRLMDPRAQSALAIELQPVLAQLCLDLKQPDLAAWSGPAARALVEELAGERTTFSTSHRAAEAERALLTYLEERGARREFEDDMRSLGSHLPERLALSLNYLDSWFDHDTGHRDLLPYRLEIAVRLCFPTGLPLEQVTTDTRVTITGLLGIHGRIENQTLSFSVDETLERVQLYLQEKVPRYRAYRKLRVELAETKKAALRLSEFMPKVLTSFVRNRLIDEVYLPLVGANLAKQLGAAGSAKRTDLMGLLLLVSPPGYGKTTLMEYIASRLGLIFMKVNGPALGNEVRSLDPSEAPNATAQQEVDKINLALEMGNNVMLYLDDIQHTHPELLQKFISLCDAQRRIEGIWRGRTRTYDLRGKRFCIVMAGNPYTESGTRFQIPDMLANRADTYNLGDILDGKQEAFALSYLENALTSNGVLAPLAGRDASDVYKLIAMAEGTEVAESELSHGYSSAEIEEFVSVFRRLLQVQKTVLRVNLEYIASASKEDRYRTEPPFKLQGSYRNMNKLAEKVVGAMNDAEIERLIDDHYAGESQTLTSAAEQNLLKLRELRGRLTPAELLRWNELKAGYCRVQRMGGRDDDPVARMTGTISGLDVQLGGIRETLSQAVERLQKRDPGTAEKPAWLEPLRAALGELGHPKVDVALTNPVQGDLVALLGSHLDHLGTALAQATQTGVNAASSAPLDTKLTEVLAAIENMTRVVADAQSLAVWEEEVELTEQSPSYFYSPHAGGDVVDDGGLFVAASGKSPAVGDIVKLTLLGSAGHRVIVRGVVALTKADVEPGASPGYYVRFLRLSEEARRFIRGWVSLRAPLPC